MSGREGREVLEAEDESVNTQESGDVLPAGSCESCLGREFFQNEGFSVLGERVRCDFTPAPSKIIELKVEFPFPPCFLWEFAASLSLEPVIYCSP